MGCINIKEESVETQTTDCVLVNQCRTKFLSEEVIVNFDTVVFYLYRKFGYSIFICSLYLNQSNPPPVCYDVILRNAASEIIIIELVIMKEFEKIGIWDLV